MTMRRARRHSRRETGRRCVSGRIRVARFADVVRDYARRTTFMTPADDLQPLQFDTAVPQNAGALDALAGLTCRNCGQTLLDEYFDVNGAPVCASCRDVLEHFSQPPRGIIPLARAALFGLGAAVAGCHPLLRVSSRSRTWRSVSWRLRSVSWSATPFAREPVGAEDARFRSWRSC